MKKTKLLFLLLACFFCLEQLLAQTARLTGKVVDAATNEPLSGVTIIVKATKKGVSTNADGSFSLNIQEGETIEVSYIGYSTITTKASRDAVIKLTALAGNNLQDVVVVGYGTQKRNKVTAAITTIKGDQLIARPSSNTSMALQGFVAGLTVRQGSGQPGADGGQLNIRGIGSINASSAPLIIVDGVEGVSLNDVDPNVIESISVLKDAASTAVYGVRATNGVILIKTKRGVSGKSSMAFNSFVSQQDPTNMPVTLS
ncbi:MAG: TonB-dependent receptor plug domain-containing protein, partial [Chitinophagaceae bacterium]